MNQIDRTKSTGYKWKGIQSLGFSKPFTGYKWKSVQSSRISKPYIFRIVMYQELHWIQLKIIIVHIELFP